MDPKPASMPAGNALGAPVPTLCTAASHTDTRTERAHLSTRTRKHVAPPGCCLHWDISANLSVRPSVCGLGSQLPPDTSP